MTVAEIAICEYTIAVTVGNNGVGVCVSVGVVDGINAVGVRVRVGVVDGISGVSVGVWVSKALAVWVALDARKVCRVVVIAGCVAVAACFFDIPEQLARNTQARKKNHKRFATSRFNIE